MEAMSIRELRSVYFCVIMHGIPYRTFRLSFQTLLRRLLLGNKTDLKCITLRTDMLSLNKANEKETDLKHLHLHDH